MLFKTKPQKFPQRYYKVLVVKEAMVSLRKDVPDALLNKSMKVKLGTIDGILAGLVASFSKQKEKG